MSIKELNRLYREFHKLSTFIQSVLYLKQHQFWSTGTYRNNKFKVFFPVKRYLTQRKRFEVHISINIVHTRGNTHFT